MKIDLKTLPFSCAGSYMVLSEISENFRGRGNSAGLYLRTVHGSAMNPLVAKVIVSEKEQESPWESETEHAALLLRGMNSLTEICFADDCTILVRGKGARLTFDFLTESGPYDYIYCIPFKGETLYMANCYKNNCRYLMRIVKGNADLEQEWEESSSLYSRLHISGEDGYEMVLKEIRTEWDRVDFAYDYETAREETEKRFMDFYEKSPSVPSKYEDTRYRAAYLNWSSIVRKDGFLRRDAMYMSKNWMCNVWSWDHCFNAIALSYDNPELAWDQFMIMFDHQDATGVLPDSINDVHIVWNYCKPPIHGWALKKMMQHMELSEEQIKEAYECLGKWTDWWFTCRDYDGDGMCEYNHGNDSGWDNSTAFSDLPPVATSELQAFLILQMEVLAELAEKLQKKEQAGSWKQRAEDTLQKMIRITFKDNLPGSVKSGTHKRIDNDSLLPFISLILSERLPEELRNQMLCVLESNRFYTEYGYATESPESTYYRSDGYWRGPIWAPSTMLILDGLYLCGRRELVRDAAVKFADMTTRSGFAENFDALTGEGLRDRAYTWTSSVFLILAHEYLSGEC